MGLCGYGLAVSRSGYGCEGIGRLYLGQELGCEIFGLLVLGQEDGVCIWAGCIYVRIGVCEYGLSVCRSG
jgi:hypothetical protein